ncbi:MAG: chromosome condensation protein [Butyrivibrio sp.]|nr:chromosome condensation protein [Butyrivibrio sp.]
MSTKYSLTAAQKLHYRWMQQYKTQQVSGLSAVASLKTDLDISLLKKCIEMELERYRCLQVQFTKPDKNGEIYQYIPEKRNISINFKDLSEMSLSEADDIMQRWAYQTFDGDDIPMCEFTLVKLPDNYNGFFIHIDHRLMDSCALVIMINDIMSLYTHYRFGSDFPDALFDYEAELINDIKKSANEKRFMKDQKFWNDLLDEYGEPLYSDIQGVSVLEDARKKHKNKNLRCADIERENLFVAVKDYALDSASSKTLMDFCLNHQLSMTNLLLLGIRTYLSKVNDGQEDITIENFISRRSTKDEWTSGGSRTIMFPCRTVIHPETDFLSGAYEVQAMQNRIYMHSNYDPALIWDEIKKRYGTPEDTTYVSCYLTYQPLPVKPENPYIKEIPMHTKWFANGAATKKMYLTVSHTPDGGMNFSYHYQTAALCEKDIEIFNYYLMRIIFRGVEQPNLTIADIIGMV